MSQALDRLDSNYNKLKEEHDVVDIRFYIGEIKESTPEQFAEEENVVLEAYMLGEVSEVKFNDYT